MHERVTCVDQIVIVPTADRIPQKIDDCNYSLLKINTVPLKEWMTAILNVTKNRYTTSRGGWLQLDWWVVK